MLKEGWKLLKNTDMWKLPDKTIAEMENTIEAYKKEYERYKKLGGKDSFKEYGLRKGFLERPHFFINWLPWLKPKKYTQGEKDLNEMIDKEYDGRIGKKQIIIMIIW